MTAKAADIEVVMTGAKRFWRDLARRGSSRQRVDGEASVALWFSGAGEHIEAVAWALGRISGRMAARGARTEDVRLTTYGDRKKPKVCYEVGLRISGADSTALARMLPDLLKVEMPHATVTRL